VALSFTEAEYMLATQATKEVIWLRHLLSELGYQQDTATCIHKDNQNCILLAQNPIHHQQTKHIDIQYHFICKKIEDGTVLHYSLCKILFQYLADHSKLEEKEKRDNGKEKISRARIKGNRKGKRDKRRQKSKRKKKEKKSLTRIQTSIPSSLHSSSHRIPPQRHFRSHGV
jgi:hypothetical protein